MYPPRLPSFRRPPRTGLATALLLGFQAWATVALAAPETLSFDIPAQPLAGALRALATQAGVQLVFTPDTPGAAVSPAIQGTLSVEAALTRLLAGSGLSFRQEGDRSYVLVQGRSTESLTATPLSEVVVTATRTERPVDEVPASVSVITRQDLAHQQLLKSEDALKNVEGMDFNTVPGNGAASVPMIRGIGGSFAGATSVVLVDGLATDSYISSVAGRGGFNFLAPQDIERMEVVRGPASALYGPNVVGGVVNVIPRRWSGATGGEFHGELGAHGSNSLGAVVGTANSLMDLRLSAYEFRTDGFVAKPNPDPNGDRDTHNRGWQDSKWNLSGGIWPGEDQEVRLSVQHFRTSQDYLGGLTDSRQKLEGDAYTLSYTKELTNDQRVQWSYRHANLLQYWDDAPSGMGVGHRRSITDTLEGQVDLHPSPANTLSLGASYQMADHLTESVTSASVTTAKAKSLGIFVQDEHRFDPWVLTVGGRYDNIDQGASTKNGQAVNGGTTENTFNPRAGLRYHFAPGTSVYTSVGTAFVPANANLKYLANGNWRDNPDLKPEKSVTYEIGVNHRMSLATLRAALYHTDYTDKISSISVGSGTWPMQYVNIGKVEVNGLELGIDGNLPGGWKPYANYTYTDSIIKKNPSSPLTEGKQVQRIAPHKLNVGVIYAPGKTWEASLMGRYVSKRYFTDNNVENRAAPAYFVADVKFSTRLPAPDTLGRWEAFVAVNNLFDKKYTVWEYEYADGRNAWIGLHGRF